MKDMRNTYDRHKVTLKDYLKGVAEILAFILFCVVVIILLSGKPKEAKTTAQMSDVLNGYGFKSVDLTQDAKEEFTGLTINEIVYYVKDDVTFEYYIFGDLNDAVSLYSAISSNLSEIERDKRINEKYVIKAGDGHRANIACTSLVTDEFFYYVCRIDKSVLNVKCNPDSKNDVYKIINELDYNMDRKESE